MVYVYRILTHNSNEEKTHNRVKVCRLLKENNKTQGKSDDFDGAREYFTFPAAVPFSFLCRVWHIAKTLYSSSVCKYYSLFSVYFSAKIVGNRECEMAHGMH